MKKDVLDFLKDKKVQWAITAVLFLVILIWSANIRVSNWDLLTDSTTGEKIPLALDPFYFLRVSETIVENGGSLPSIDSMRGPLFDTPWSAEILPSAVVGLYKISSIFDSSVTLRGVDVASPVVFYCIGLILFFFLAYFLTKSKTIATVSSGLLAFSPAYLYRTMAGFSDHEAIGMVAVFACLLFYFFAMRNMEKSWTRSILFGIGTGFFTSLVIACWGGAITFILITIPPSMLLYWLLKKEDSLKTIVFYVSWIISSLILPGIFNIGLVMRMQARFMTSYGLLVPAVLLFVLLDFGVEELRKKKKFGISKENKLLYTIGSLVVLGSIALTFIGKNIFSVIVSVWRAVLFPFGMDRTGTTVAENSQPYLTDWMSQNGTVVFWLFVFGIFLAGIELAKSIRSRKERVFFSGSWVLMISCMIFSRISSESIMNGENFLSQLVYLVGVFVFVGYFIYLNMHEKFDKKKIMPFLILFGTLMFVVVLNGRSAARTFFLITPFVCLSASYFVFTLGKYALKAKEEVLKIILWGLVILSVVGLVMAFNDYRVSVTYQAQYTGPSASAQWQNAMSWVRDNVPEDNVFAHWWDYGYWVQGLGERATIADGGHFQGTYSGNERIGRYVLTTDNPDTAYSFLKTLEVSNLLIDPTDLGKYSAYSRIGSDDDWDRYSVLPVGTSNEDQVQETSTGVTRIYTFTSVVDEDIQYEGNFLPGPSFDEYGRPSYKSYLAGIISTISNSDGGSMTQPEAVYIYNNIQYRIPLRYVYIEGELHDFGKGLDATMMIIPRAYQTSQGLSINRFGAAIYLSPKTQSTLFARLYLEDDPMEEYSDFTLVHSEDSPVVAAIKSQSDLVTDFLYYGDFIGPIKIWEVNYPEGTETYQEFLVEETGYGDMDDKFY